MAKHSERVREALRAVGAVLKRDKKHHVYALPNGKSVTVSATPSDVRASANALRDIKHAAGISPAQKAAGPAKVKRAKPGRVEEVSFGLPAEHSPMAAALRETGLVEARLRSRIGELESQLASVRWKLETTERELATLRGERPVRVWLWLREAIWG